MDASLASAGMSFLSGAIGAYYNNKVADIQAKAANGVRDYNNATALVEAERDKQLTGYQRWAQTVRNSRVQESVAAHQQALTTNFNRARDARTRQNFVTNIQQAEEQGRQQAAAAVAGVTGSVVDVINDTTRLRNAMERTARLDAESQTVYDYKVQEQAQRLAIEDSIDWGIVFDNGPQLDYYTNVANKQNVLATGLASVSAKEWQGSASAVTNFFKTPVDNSIFGMLKTNQGVGS